MLGDNLIVLQDYSKLSSIISSKIVELQQGFKSQAELPDEATDYSKQTIL